MKVPTLTLVSTAKLPQSVCDEILILASQELSTTDGLIDTLKKRQRLALYRHRGELIGMTAIDILPHTFENEKVCAIYTGSAWIRSDWRNYNLIQFLGYLTMIEAKVRNPFHKIAWVLGSNSFMSYRLMCRNFDCFWPHPDRATPVNELTSMRHFGHLIFGEAFDPDTLIWSEQGARSFTGDDIAIPENQKDDRFIQHYLKLNPNFAKGDKLMCLVPITSAAIVQLLKRSVKRAKKY